MSHTALPKPWYERPFASFTQFYESGKLPHALIISGNKDIGKLEFAQLLASHISHTDVSHDNLNEVDDELLLRNSTYQHLIYIMREKVKSGKIASKISVNQIRAFSEFLYKTSSALQIGIISYGDDLTINASNALLKTLEEPRANTLIIILSHNIQNLPITIISRCMHIHLSAHRESLSWVKENLSTHSHSLNDKELLNVLAQNDYTPIRVVDKINSGEYQLEQGTKEELLAIGIKRLQVEALSHVQKPHLVFHVLFGLLREISIVQCTTHTTSMSASTSATPEALLHISQKANKQHIAQLFSDVQYANYLLGTTVNPKLLTDNILIIWSHITDLSKYPTIFGKI